MVRYNKSDYKIGIYNNKISTVMKTKNMHLSIQTGDYVGAFKT